MIVTFYSYKGGVGRSMALANVADLLARNGLKTLIVDFDLEAPGLEQYFQTNQASARRNVGLLDLLLAYKQSMSVAGGEDEQDGFRNLDRFIVPIYQTLPGGGRLDLLPAGQRETREHVERYASRLRTFDWQDFYVNWEGELFFEWLRTTLVPKRYDLVLVDSRTGVTEMGGICTYQLADVIVMLCGANVQNQQGTGQVITDFLSSPVQAARQNRPLTLVVVPARVEQRDPALFQAFMADFERTFAAQLPQVLRASSLGFQELAIPYEPQYAFNEVVVSDPARAEQRRTIAGAFERIARALVLLAPAESPVAQKHARDRAAAGDGARGMELTAPAAQYDAAKRFADYDIFLAYGAGDTEAVEQLTFELRRRGLNLFLDRQELAAGDDWRARTEQALFHSRACFVCYGRSGGPASTDDLLAAVRSVRGSRSLPLMAVYLPGYEGTLTLTEGALRQLLDLRGGLDTPEAQAKLDRLAVPFGSAPEPEPGLPPTPPHANAPTPTVVAGAPYVGLDAFAEKDAGFLFGRDTETRDITAAILQYPCVVLVGASGSGKTSLVMAGVLPRLRQTAKGGAGWVSARCTPMEFVQEGSLQHALAVLDAAAKTTPGVRRLLFLDQFEEILLLPDPLRTAYLQELSDVVDHPATDTHLLIAIREDRAGAAAVPAAWNPHVVPVPPLSADGIRLAIERAAERAGLAFEPGLVDRLIEDWGRDQRFLPFLQLMLVRLWEQRRDGYLTNRAYDEIPDPVEEIANRAFSAMPTASQRVTARLVPRLIWLCQNLSDLSVSCARSDLRLRDLTETDVEQALGYLIDARLVCAFAGPDGSARVAPTFLVEQWTVAEGWANPLTPFLDWLVRFDRYRRDWIRTDHDSGALLSGQLLTDAREWANTRPDDLSEAEHDYIQQSQEHARKMRRWNAMVMLGIVVVVFSFWGWTYWKNYQATSRSNRATALIEQAAQAATGGDPKTAVANYREALTLAPDNLPARLKLGAILDQQGDSNGAISNLNTLIAQASAGESGSRPTDLLAEAYLARGVAWFHNKAPAQALADLDAAVKLAGGDPLVRFNRGVVYESLGRADDALHEYSVALTKRPDFADAAFNRGALYQKRNDRAAATADFGQVLQMPSASPQTKEAARTRLAQLGATASTAPRENVRVFLHMADPSDRSQLQRIATALTAEGFDVQGVQQVQQSTTGDVRYFFKEDEDTAGQVRQIAERELNAAGFNVRLSPTFVSIFSTVKPGTIEVWIPPLRLRLLSKDPYANSAPALQSKP